MDIRYETERLLLRPVTQNDLEGFFALDSDPEVHRYLGNQPVTSIDQSQKMIENILSQYEKYGLGRLAMVEKSSGAFVGWSGIKYETMVREEPYYDLGYRLIRKYWGQGYATEAAWASLRWGYHTHGLESIYAAAEQAHGASNHILQKVGGQLQGTFEFEGIPCYWYRMQKPPA